MKLPNTLSASSLQNLEDCPTKFHAVNIKRIPEVGDKAAAKNGSAVHFALQHFVHAVYLAKTHTWGGYDNSGNEGPGGLKYLLELYDIGFEIEFDSAWKKSGSWYKDGQKMLKDWHKRTDLAGWTIDYVEIKKRIPLADTGVKLTYIFDRVSRIIDKHGRKVLKVTDYKTENRTYSFEELETKLQALIYALCAMIEYSWWEPDVIQVELDMLRYSPTGATFSPEDNEETWEYLLKTVHRIAQMPDDPKELRRTLGSGCTYCPIAASCNEWKKNVEGGGDLSLMDIEKLAPLRYEVKAIADTSEKQLKVLDAKIRQYSEATGESKFTAAGHPVKFIGRGTRDLTDPQMAAQIIGPKLMAMFGQLKMADVDKILDSGDLDAESHAALTALITKKYGQGGLTVKVDAIPATKKESVA